MNRMNIKTHDMNNCNIVCFNTMEFVSEIDQIRYTLYNVCIIITYNNI